MKSGRLTLFAVAVGMAILVALVVGASSRRAQFEASAVVATTSTARATTTSSPTTTSAPPTTDPVDGVAISPGTHIQGVVNSHPAGTRFVLLSGRHSRQSVSPRDGDVFVGESGAIMDGENQTAAAFHGVAKNVTVEGLVIENYTNPAQRGAIDSHGPGWRILSNEIRFNAGAGIVVDTAFVIDGNHIHHNEQIGINGRGANGKVINNEIAYNNHNNKYEMGWEAGGTKFLRTTDLYVAHNKVHHNHGPGLWTDHNNYRTIYEKNTVRDNHGPGILHEISYDAVIRNNTVTGNAHQYYFGGILISSSPNVEVHGNSLSGNDGGIIGLQDNRGSGDRGVYQTTNLDIHNNNVNWGNGFHGVHYNSGPDVLNSGTINFQNNTYTSTLNKPFRFGAKRSGATWEEWMASGFDLSGSFQD